MNSTPHSFNTVLLEGAARGLRVSDIPSRTPQVFAVPRASIDAYLRMPESANFSVVLFVTQKSSNDLVCNHVAISKGPIADELVNIPPSRVAWDKLLIIQSKAHDLTIPLLELIRWKLLKEVAKTGRLCLAPGFVIGNRPDVSRSLEIQCDEFIQVSTLLVESWGFTRLFAKDSEFGVQIGRSTPAPTPQAALGFETAVEPVAPSVEPPAATPSITHFVSHGNDLVAFGKTEDDGFLILKGSHASIPSQSNDDADAQALYVSRIALLRAGVIATKNAKLVFTQDWPVATPYDAYDLIYGAIHPEGCEWKPVIEPSELAAA